MKSLAETIVDLGEFDAQSNAAATSIHNLNDRRTMMLREIRQRVLTGETTNDRLLVVAVVNYGSAAMVAHDQLVALDKKVADTLGEPVLVVEQTKSGSIFSEMKHASIVGPHIDVLTRILLGILNGTELIVQPLPSTKDNVPLNISTALSDIYFMADHDRRLIGFPTARYVCVDDRSRPILIEGALFPAEDLIHNQLSRQMSAMIPGLSSSRPKITVMVGTDAVSAWFNQNQYQFRFLTLTKILESVA